MDRGATAAGYGMVRRLMWTGVCLSLAPAPQAIADGRDNPSGAAAAAQVDFERDVAPILRQQCVDCHGPALQLADLRLDQRHFVLEAGRERNLVEPGRSADSLLIRRLVDKEQGLIMPPTFPFFPQDKLGLPEAQIQTLRRWIDEGAHWPDGVTLAAEAKSGGDSAAATALFAAIRAGDRAAVAKLLADRSLVNARDRHRATPLLHAALTGDVALLQLLAERGADVNAADEGGGTALMYAADNLAKVRWLVEHGANVNARSALGRTPLLIASTYAGNAPVVRFLLQAGAQPSVRDVNGETALTSASKRGDAELVEILIAAGADVRGGGGLMGRTPLAWAAEEGNLATLTTLLQHGAGADRQSVSAALFNAAVRGPTEAVRLLLQHNPDVNAHAGFAGYTPLMGAAYSERLDVETVRLLLERGADVRAQAATGATALDLARQRGPTEVVALLEKSPAPAKGVPVSASSRAAAPPQVRAAAEKSLALLQKCGPEFFRKSGCVACHQQSVTSFALAEARSRGLPVDEEVARDQVRVTAVTIKSYRDRFLQRVDHPASSAPATGYILLGLAAEKHPADEYTDANVIAMAGRQLADGSWTAFGHRPPLEYSRIAATALAVRALQLYGPPGLQTSFAERIARGRQWLLDAAPAANSDHAFRLLGLAWSGADQQVVKAQAAALVAQQREDGGWAQLEQLDADAYATGLTLYALHHGGRLSTADAVYQRGVAYLLQTQLPDGSWHVGSRSFPFQPYFESGFPHGHDQWISASATGYAAAALIDALPPTAAAAK